MSFINRFYCPVSENCKTKCNVRACEFYDQKYLNAFPTYSGWQNVNINDCDDSRVTCGIQSNTTFMNFERWDVNNPDTSDKSNLLSFGDPNQWQLSSIDSFSGAFSLKSGDLGHNSASYVDYDVDVFGTGTFMIKFAYRTDCEIKDRLQFFIDDKVQLNIGGIMSKWDFFKVQISPGPHKLRWSFVKDRDISSGQNTVYIDDISIETSKMDRVISLSLNNENLFGPIPDIIGEMNGLVALNLSNNNLINSIPFTFLHLQNLQTIDLSYNQISGPFPVYLMTFQELFLMDMSYNDMNGNLPEYVGDIILEVLKLSNNKFSGLIPNNWLSFTSLKFIDISNNNLTGNVIDFQQLNSLTFLNISNNDLIIDIGFCAIGNTVGCDISFTRLICPVVSVCATLCNANACGLIEPEQSTLETLVTNGWSDINTGCDNPAITCVDEPIATIYDFEDQSLSEFTISGQAGANSWTISNQNPFSGIYSAYTTAPYTETLTVRTMVLQTVSLDIILTSFFSIVKAI